MPLADVSLPKVREVFETNVVSVMAVTNAFLPLLLVGHGGLVVNIQGDGELMCAPGSLWTAVHHKIPLLNVMHNNRAYHQETMHIQRMANRHERGIDRAAIGTTLTDPAVDFAKLAQGMGVWATGPVENPADLRPALRKALDVVKHGEPALVDVMTQPR